MPSYNNARALCPDKRTPACTKSENGYCTCLSDTTFSPNRRDANGNIRCPFYCSAEQTAAMRCSRKGCVYQERAGYCSNRDMYQDCPWMRRSAHKNYSDSPPAKEGACV